MRRQFPGQPCPKFMWIIVVQPNVLGAEKVNNVDFLCS